MPAHTLTPLLPWGTLFTTLTSANRSPTQRYTWYVRLFGHTGKFSKMTLEAAYGREINITFSGNSSGGHSCSQNANCTLPQLETSVALCCVTKLDILKYNFIVPCTRCTCVMIMLQVLDMPHLSGGWIILAKEKCSLRGM